MNSIVLPLFNKQRMDYSFLGNTSSQQVTLQSMIDVASYKTIMLLVRVHRLDMSSGQAFSFSLYNTLPSDEDSQDFTDYTSAFAPVLTLSIGSGTTAPALKLATASGPGPYLKLVMTATQGSVGGTALYAEMSASLLARLN